MWPQQDAKVQISATSSCARASFHFLQSLLAIYKARATALLPLESTIKEKLGSNWRKKLSGSTGWLEVVSQTRSIFTESADIPKNLFKASLYRHTRQTTQHDLTVTSADATDNVSTPRDHHMMVIWLFLPESSPTLPLPPQPPPLPPCAWINRDTQASSAGETPPSTSCHCLTEGPGDVYCNATY